VGWIRDAVGADGRPRGVPGQPLYASLQAGRIRQAGKLAVAASRVYLAQDRPSDALFGLIIGVAVPLAAFRVAHA
jgi:hypothetical protein